MYLKINNKKELILFADYLENTPLTWIAIDTEFYRETTYFPVLSLIQIATENQVWIIDALGCNDLTPLKNILENKKIKKIFHAGDQDWLILKQMTGAITWPFTDTQIMAAFVKLGHSNSLEVLVSKLLEITIDKSQQKTDWLKRPLTEKQLEYAAEDAAYVAKIYPILQNMLERLERTTWVDQEIENLLQKYNSNGVTRDWLKLCFKGCKWPTPYFALELVRWREELAMKLDIPKRHVISDALLEKALRDQKIDHITENNCLPLVLEELTTKWQTFNFRYRGSKEEKDALCQQVRNHHQEFSIDERAVLKSWQKKAKKISENLDIPAHLFLNKQQLHQLVCGDEAPTFGWKKKFLE